MNIVFFGTDEFSVAVLKHLVTSEHKITLVVTSPDLRAGRGGRTIPPALKTFALEQSLEVIQPARLDSPDFIRRLTVQIPDFFVVASYGRIIKSEILNLPRYYPLNVHPSLLPKHRGAAPVANSILQGDKFHGVTIIRMNEKVDAGPILAQTAIKADDTSTRPELERTLATIGAQLLIEVIGRMKEGVNIEIPQDDALATSTAKLEKRNGKIIWVRTAEEICRHIRAYSPWPGSFAFYRGKMVKFHVVEAVQTTPPPVPPGTILFSGDEFFYVVCRNGALRIKLVQPENSKPMAAKDFVNGYRLKEMDRFE